MKKAMKKAFFTAFAVIAVIFFARSMTTPAARTVQDTTMIVWSEVGKYSGYIDKYGNPDGEGEWISENITDAPGHTWVINGQWNYGEPYNGTLEWYYNGYAVGKASIVNGVTNEADIETISANIKKARSNEEWNDTVDGIKEIGGYIGDFIHWYDSLG